MHSDSTPFAVSTPAGSLVGERLGTGEPVLLLHGGPGLSDYTGPLAEELAVRYQVYRYQQRGLVPSTVDGPFDVETHVSDVKSVLDAMSLEKVWIVGHSWGGHLALFVAVNMPERLRGLVVVEPLGAIEDGGIDDMSRNLLDRLTPEATRRLARRQRQVAKGAPGDEPLWPLKLVWPGYFADPPAAPSMPDLRTSTECNADTFESIQAHFRARTLETSLDGITLPCVFLVGVESPIPVIHARRTAAIIPGARVIEIDGCGHFPWIQRPGHVLAALDGLALA